MALATMSTVAVGATTSRYIAVMKEMNVLCGNYVMVVWKGTPVIEGFPIGGWFPETTAEKLIHINLTKNVTPMFFVLNFGSKMTLQLLPSSVTIGVDPGKWSVLVGSIPLQEGGSWPSTNATSREIVVGSSFADQYELAVGSETIVKNTSLRVSGILKPSSVVLSRAIIMPLALSQEVYEWSMMINMIAVEPKEGVSQQELAQRIESEISTFDALTEEERNDIMQPVLGSVEMFNIGVQSMLFLMSIILVANVAMMNVSERRRDFATLDAIGTPKTYVSRMVMTETMLMGLSGSAVGVPLGALASLFIASVYTNIPLILFFPSIFEIVSPSLIIQILILTFVISFIAGVLPSVTAAKTRIGEFLRSEY
jgi:ABC-type lipoprotein release transport system permease subunit